MENYKFKGYCDKCKKKPFCTELCATVLPFVEQDQRSPDPFLPLGSVDNMYLGVFPYRSPKTDKRLLYELYFLDGKTASYIAKMISYSEGHISYLLSGLRDSIESMGYVGTKKAILKNHFEEKLQVKEIAALNNVTPRYVWMVIREHLLANGIE